MKRAFVAAFVLCVFLASLGTASAATVVRVTVPFSFHAGEVVLPAGEYVFEMGANLTVRSADGKDSYFVPVSSQDRSLAGGKYAVTFTKYESTYFLSKITLNDHEVLSTKTRLEKRLAQLSSRPATIAQLRQK